MKEIQKHFPGAWWETYRMHFKGDCLWMLVWTNPDTNKEQVIGYGSTRIEIKKQVLSKVKIK